MHKTLLLLLTLLTLTACGNEEPKPLVCTTKPIQSPFELQIIDKPIDFGEERIAMTKEYIKSHYGKTVNDITITPKIILLHWTAEMSFDKSFKRLQPEKLLSDRKDIMKASALNVSSQFMVARDGTIYRLMPENWMARHVIGLNYSSIGVENIGGKGNKIDDLTPAQRQANIDLVLYLKAKYPSIEYLVGHHEYKQMESTSLWLEKDKGYRTVKSDPGEKFMSDIRNGVKCLNLKAPPKGK
jgi:N-acetylmuramoyl-L-alanine amidase